MEEDVTLKEWPKEGDYFVNLSMAVSYNNALMVEWSVRNNPYSWSIDYFDDWRCVCDYLKARTT